MLDSSWHWQQEDMSQRHNYLNCYQNVELERIQPGSGYLQLCFTWSLNWWKFGYLQGDKSKSLATYVW